MEVPPVKDQISLLVIGILWKSVRITSRKFSCRCEGSTGSLLTIVSLDSRFRGNDVHGPWRRQAAALQVHAAGVARLSVSLLHKSHDFFAFGCTFAGFGICLLVIYIRHGPTL
jgi:hypothetical protein